MVETKSDNSIWYIGAAWFAIVLSVDVGVGSMYVRDVRTELFETTAGVVTKSDIKPGRRGAVLFDLEFTYTVNGRQYTGTEYHPQKPCASPRYWREACDANPPGTCVAVHYDPDDPQTAYLTTGLRPDVLLTLLLLSPFNLITALFPWGGRNQLAEPRSFDPALRRCVRRAPDGWLVRPDPNTVFFGTVFVMLFMGTFFSFVPVVILIGVFDGTPPWWASSALWVLIFVVATVLAVRKSRRGLFHFNESEKTLTFVHNTARITVVRRAYALCVESPWST